jgi:hypothetical protein
MFGLIKLAGAPSAAFVNKNDEEQYASSDQEHVSEDSS